jgi:short-subunit dehydrogenase
MKKKILITGCSSGLGIFLVNKFQSEGHDVFQHLGKKHYDLSDINDIKKLANEAIDFNVDVLVNNAAIVCPNILLNEYTEELIFNMIDVNLRAPILLSYYLQSHLTDIININSMVGLEYKKPRTLYSATKWGLRGFSNSLRLETSQMNILDVYTTNIKTTPERENALDANYVVNNIYEAFLKKESELILDGRIS